MGKNIINLYLAVFNMLLAVVNVLIGNQFTAAFCWLVGCLVLGIYFLRKKKEGG